MIISSYFMYLMNTFWHAEFFFYKQEYDASFFEVSAKSGDKIRECMEALAR